MSEYGLLQKRRRLFCSNMELRIQKTRNKYLTEEQEEKLRKFRPEGIIRKYPTITCRYNSFGKINPHIQDGNRVRVLNHEEALALQTFPFYFNLGDNFTQREIEILIGNAVPPAFSYKIAMAIQSFSFNLLVNSQKGTQKTFV
jgi:site-specific DNA-cytosine methylase